MLVAMAKDIRVLLIKLADRLHNMRTIASLPEFKQRRIAQETLDIYAPLAHRLGIADMKWQLEDTAFAVLYPLRYAEIEQMVATQAPEREEFLSTVLTDLRARLDELKIDADVKGRPKHYWSIYEKMITRGKQFDDVQDLVGVRVVVESVKDCYAALGSIHAMWKPVQGRFKDYIAMPKFNLYQSLHTTVVGPTGKAVEVQIRTQEMHRRAEYGVAAHWGYKEREPAEDLLWLQRMVDWQQETSDPGEFMEALKIDLEYDEVFVFTPKGKVITLAAGATPVDFAYAIHTDVGHRCIGARVNGRLVPLDSGLASGDSVEIFTSKVEGAGPSRDWLQFVHTPKARTKIRQWFSRERRVDAIDSGREELAKALRKDGLPVQKLASSSSLLDVAVAMHYADVEALHAAIGENHVSAKAVVQRLQKELRSGEEQLPITATRPPERARRSERRATGVHVEGLDDVMVRLSRCCTPVPGDEIMGFVTRGRGVSVHRTDCANAAGPGRPRRAGHRGGVGPRPARHVRGVGRDRGARPVTAPPRRRARPRRVPREHPLVHVADVDRAGRQVPLRLRARRPQPPRVDPVGGQADRERLRRVPGAARTREGRGRGRGVGPTRWQIRKTERSRLATGRVCAVGGAESTIEGKTERSRLAAGRVRAVGGAESTIEGKTERRSARRFERATELLERVVADPSVLEAMSEHERVRFVNAAGDVFCPDVDERRRRSKARQRRQRSATLAHDDAVLAGTGIRRLRAKPVFTTPNVFPPDGFTPDDVLDDERGAGVVARPAALLRVQGQVHRRPPLLRPALPDVRGVQLREAHRISRSARRVALLTGGRVKIGYQAGIKLLRAGAELIVTTRFPRDAALRYAREPDFDDWGDRLEVFGLDLRYTPSVEAFCHHVDRTRDRLDFVVNNACQTVRRPPAFYEHMMDVETASLARMPATVRALMGEYADAVGVLRRACRSARCCPARRRRVVTCSRRARSTRTCSRSTSATATRGG